MDEFNQTGYTDPEPLTGEPVAPASESDSGEYHYKAEELPEVKATAPAESYSYYPGRGSSVSQPPAEKTKKRISVGMAAVLCLICIILAAALGIGGALLFARDRDADTADEEFVEEEAAVVTPTPEPVLVTNSVADTDQLSPSEIYELACEEVVGVTTEITYYNIFGQQGNSVVSGTGFIITEDGYILTNYHVIEDAYEGGYQVSVFTHDGTEYAAEVVGTEEDNDIAVLKIEASDLNPVELGDSNELLVGQTIYTVGNPLGELEYTMTCGIVSAMNRSIQTENNTTVNMFQIDAAVNSGNSGGPIYNDHGQVIGIVTAKYMTTGVEGLGFGIPISDANFIANELITNGYVSGKASIGGTLTTVSASAAQYYNMVEGAYVYSLVSGGCGEKAGLKVGDIITAIGELDISSSADFISALKKYRAGDTAQLTVYRNGESFNLSVTFDEEVPEEEDETESSHGASGEFNPNEYYYEYSGSLEDFMNQFGSFFGRR